MSRDYLFDNLKALLIFLVVVGHFVGPSTSCNTFLLLLKWVIVSFHMPAFILISGYFSKKEQSFWKMCKRLALPYLVYEVIYYLWYVFLLHKDTGLELLKPKFTLWYLLALFLWRVITPYFKKIPYHMILALVLGILIGFSNMEDNLLTIPRALFFYPFYLAGTYLDRDWLQKLRDSKKVRLGALAAVIGITLLLCLIGFYKIAPMQIFYGRYNYAVLKQAVAEGILWRCFAYVIGFCMSYALLVLMTDRKLSVSYLGTRTMAIYLFHGLTYKFFESNTRMLKGLDDIFETFALLLACVLLTLIFSLKPFTAFTNLCSGVFPSWAVKKSS